MGFLGRRPVHPRAAASLSTFAKALRIHIQETSILQPKEPPSFYQIAGTALVLAGAVVLMVILGLS